MTIVESRPLSFRNEVENFQHNDWSVRSIPDPQDPDPRRHALLAAAPHLLARSFNRLIEMGAPRDASAILMVEDEKEVRARPPQIEQVSDWCEQVSPLSEVLVISNEKGEVLDDKHSEEADDILLRNILAFQQPIFFV